MLGLGSKVGALKVERLLAREVSHVLIIFTGLGSTIKDFEVTYAACSSSYVSNSIYLICLFFSLV